MPVLEFPALFVTPEVKNRSGARIRFGTRMARLAARGKRLRRMRLDLSVLTTSGPLAATLTALTLYGATLDGSSRLRRRELVALRLPSGWRVKARVGWTLGRRCGVTFLAPVADFARVLRESRMAPPSRRGPRPLPATMPAPRDARRDRRRQWLKMLSRIRRMGRQIVRWCRNL